MRKTRKIATAAGAAVAALAIAASPAGAVPGGYPGKPDKPEKPAKPDKPGKKPKGVAHVFKGAYAGDGMVDVEKTNKHAREFEGQTVVFDLSGAKVSVADTTGDGVADLADVVVGDSVVVKAKLPKGETPAQPIAAKHLVDQTNHAPEA